MDCCSTTAGTSGVDLENSNHFKYNTIDMVRRPISSKLRWFSIINNSTSKNCLDMGAYSTYL